MTAVTPASTVGNSGPTPGRLVGRSQERERDSFNLALFVALLGAPGVEDLGSPASTPGDGRPRPRGASNASASFSASAEFAGEFMDASAAATRGAHPRTASGFEPGQSGTSQAYSRPAATENSEPEPAAVAGQRTGGGTEGGGTPPRAPAAGNAASGPASPVALAAMNAIGPPAAPAGGKPGAAPAATSSQPPKLATTGTRTGSPLVVPFRDLDGSEGRIRVTVRAHSLSATIFSSSREMIRHLGDGIVTLQKALAEHGFGQSHVAVHQTAHTSDLDPQSDRPGAGPHGDQHSRRRARDEDHRSGPADRSFTAALSAKDPRS